MPIYEFKCLECGRFEEFRPISRSGEVAYCPRCGGHGRKVFSLAGHYSEFAGFKEDYYPAFEKYIGDGREFRDEIKRCEEEYFEDTGIAIEIGHKR